MLSIIGYVTRESPRRRALCVNDCSRQAGQIITNYATHPSFQACDPGDIACDASHYEYTSYVAGRSRTKMCNRPKGVPHFSDSNPSRPVGNRPVIRPRTLSEALTGRLGDRYEVAAASSSIKIVVRYNKVRRPCAGR
jgi:hypothetical protein